MTGTELKDLNTEIRGGREMDDTTFFTLANLAKSMFERRRAWRKLVSKDTSKTSLTSDTFATSKALPSTFIMTLPRRTLKLVSSDNAVLEYTEVPWEEWDNYKLSAGYFTIDHANSLYYLSGTVNQTYTHNFYFIGTSAAIAAGTSWVFPSEFHPALAFEVAAMDELGMDYDEINARQGNQNAIRAELIMRQAIKWDDALQRSALGI